MREKEPMLREESEEMKTLQKNRSFAKTQKDTKKFKKGIGLQANNDESLRNHSEICSMVSEDNYWNTRKKGQRQLKEESKGKSL